MSDSTAPTMEDVQKELAAWADNRRAIIDRLRVIADTLDGWFKADHAVTVAGSSVGIVGGGMLLGGLLFPPLAIPGILLSLAGAGSKIGVSLAHIASIKSLAAEAHRLCEDDALRLSSFVKSADELIGARAATGAAAAATNALKASVHFLRRTFITVPNAAGRASLKAILPAAAVGPIRIVAGVTAGIGMAIDVVSLIGSASSLAKNETDELAVKIREIADQLEKELNDATKPPPIDDQQ